MMAENARTGTLAPPDPADWMARGEAARFLMIDEKTLDGLVEQGLLTRRRVARARPKYLRADVERLAREAITPAVNQAR